MTMQQYMLRHQKATAGSNRPLYLPAIDIYAANGVHPASLYSTPTSHHSFSPTSFSQSSSFSNESWTSAQDESSFLSSASSYSSSASFVSALSTPCPPWLHSYSSNRLSSNSIQYHFTPPTTTLETLLERLSHNDMPASGMHSLRERYHPFQHSGPPQADFVTPPSPGNTADAKRPAKSLIKTEKYKTEMCRSWEEKGQCGYGQKCMYAHGPQEMRAVSRHPKYKTELCHSFIKTGSCPYAKRCVFVHSTSLMNVETPTQKATNSDVRKTPLLSRVGVRRAAPTFQEHQQVPSVDVQGVTGREEYAAVASSSPYTLPLVEKWGREMASFPSHWLSSSYADYPAPASIGSRPLRADLHPLMVV